MNKYKFQKLRKFIEQTSVVLPDESAIEVPELFPLWKINVHYNVGDRIQYNDVLYKVLQAHDSIESWTPENAPSLFARVLIPDPEQIYEWEQPDSTNPYMTGDKVIHNGKTWESIVDNNVWEPGVYGWKEIE